MGLGGLGSQLRDTGPQRPLSVAQDTPPRLIPPDCIIVDADKFKCILYRPRCPGGPSRALLLLNRDLVVVDPYEEAQGTGECLPGPRWAPSQGSVAVVLWPRSRPPGHGLCPPAAPVTPTTRGE